MKTPIGMEFIDNASLTLAHYIAASGRRALPPQVVHDFKRALLDYASCLLAGTGEPVVRSMLECLVDDELGATSSIQALASRLTGTNAAFLNGIRAHAMDFDDGYTQGSCHPGAAIFPAALAVAKKYGSTPGRIISAVVAGYDVMLRISATAHPTTAKFGFHNTGVAGIFGATAACAVVMDLDTDKSLAAMGLAASFAGGVLEFLEDGSDAKRLHAGKAARDGLLCAQMAARGISGPARGLEGRFGFFNAFARGEIRPEFLLEGLGEKFLVSHAYFKLYPCCRHYHAAIDAARSLRQDHELDVDQIERVDIGLYGLGVQGHDQQVVRTMLEAQMSAPCAVALSLLDGNVTRQSFSADSLAREELKRLMQKTQARQDAVCESLYPRVRSGMVRVHFKSGGFLDKRVEDPKGEESNPLSDQELEEKFVENSQGIISDAQIRRTAQLIWNFDERGTALLGEIF